MVDNAGIRAAAARMRGDLHVTPVTLDSKLGAIIKWENHQVTGSFKARGALNAVKSLSPQQLKAGIVAVSAGNHGQGIALAAAGANCRAHVFLPYSAATVKVDAIQKLGAELHFIPGGYEQAEAAAILFARQAGMPFISPYNNEQVISGQGTIGLELENQIDLSQYRQVVVPVGGGGLISGIGMAILDAHPGIHLIGAQAAGSPFFHAVFHGLPQENIIEDIGLADGLEGRVDVASITIPLVRRLVEDIVLISEEGIKAAIRYAWQAHGEVIEGSAAVALAALLDGKINAEPTVVVISGGNIHPPLFTEIVANTA